MTRGVRCYLVSSLVLAALVAVAGCSHYLLAEREPWRHEAEVACLNSGAVTETPERVRISAINGPAACGMDYPIRVSTLGESAPLGYDDEAVRPPGTIPPPWPGAAPSAIPSSPVQSSALPPVRGAAQSYPVAPQPYPTAQVGPPLSLDPPGLRPTGDNDEDIGIPGGPPPPPYPPPLAGKGRVGVTASAGPVELNPPATLACPIVSALDQWISTAVQAAALHWFRQRVVEIKQISAYSCRGMNGDPNAHISEHAFGNALDVAEFDLADGHKISVQYGWHGTPQEQGFLHDVQAAACDEFSTVLAPGANVYHYNHIHVDLMRRTSGRHVCEPTAIPGEVVAERARARFAARHDRDPNVTGAIKTPARERRYSGEDDDSLPLAVPGDD